MNPTGQRCRLLRGNEKASGKRTITSIFRDHVDSSKRYDKEVTAMSSYEYPPGAVCPAKVRLGEAGDSVSTG